MDLFGTALGLSIKKSVYPVLAHPIQALNISHYLLFHLSKVVGAGKLCTIPTQDVEGAIGRTTNLSVSERESFLGKGNHIFKGLEAWPCTTLLGDYGTRKKRRREERVRARSLKGIFLIFSIKESCKSL